MSKTRWYKAAKAGVRAEAKSMLANDGEGVEEALINDGWSKDKPEGYVEADPQRSTDEMLTEALDLIETLQAEIVELKKTKRRSKAA